MANITAQGKHGVRGIGIQTEEGLTHLNKLRVIVNWVLK